jgi:hypothetical protein
MLKAKDTRQWMINASGFFSRTLFFRLNIKRGPTTPHRKLFTAYHSTTCCNTWTSLAQKSLKFQREKKNPVHVSCSMIKNIAYCSSTFGNTLTIFSPFHGSMIKLIATPDSFDIQFFCIVALS